MNGKQVINEQDEQNEHPKADVSAALEELDGALRKFFTNRVAARDAEDLLQEAYLRVSRALSDLKDHERLAGWVFQIARNLVVDYRRSKDKYIEEGLDETEYVRPEEEAPTLEVGRWLGPLIDQLPSKYAEVLRDSELNEVPHREIAERLGLSVSGIKSRVQRGRVLLREKLEACCSLKFGNRGSVIDYECKEGGAENCCGPDSCS